MFGYRRPLLQGQFLFALANLAASYGGFRNLWRPLGGPLTPHISPPACLDATIDKRVTEKEWISTRLQGDLTHCYTVSWLELVTSVTNACDACH